MRLGLFGQLVKASTERLHREHGPYGATRLTKRHEPLRRATRRSDNARSSKPSA